MPFVQNSEIDVNEMLRTIGVDSIEALFADIAEELRVMGHLELPSTKSEADVQRELRRLAGNNEVDPEGASFLGAGIERHFIPHIVDHISLDGNFITAYTPYQPEVSQGTLTAIFEFQSMLSALTGLGVSNASLYDGATAAAEAAFVAYHYCAKTHRKEKRHRLLVPTTVHPEFRQTLATYVASGEQIDVVEIPYKPESGLIDGAAFSAELAKGGVIGALLPYPSFFGTFEDLSGYADELHNVGAVAIALAHPLALGILKSPGEMGCDIAVGEGQPLGCYSALGGPAFGFFSCSTDFVRYAPGRIVSETVDQDGKRGFCLSLSTREQHIRREKATSNICTNQALMALRAAIYMASLGKQGMVELSEQIASNTRYAVEQLEAKSVKRRFAGAPCFNEFVVEGSADIPQRARAEGLQMGLDLGRFYDELRHCYQINISEIHQKDDIDRLVSLFS